MWEKIAKTLKEHKAIGIFGCTQLGRELYELLKSFDENAEIFFIDNSEKMQKSGYCGEKVTEPGQLKNKQMFGMIILAGYAAFREMKAQLIELGIPEADIFIPESILLREAERKTRLAEEKVRRRMPKKTLSFVVDLAEHCNLNCQNCDHFSPLAEECFTELTEFDRDLHRLRQLFGDRISHIDLEGGEPLLNKDIIQFIEAAHKHFPATLLQIFTNGILLPEMSEAFWETCRKHRVVLEVTKYPIKLDYDRIGKMAEEKGVELKYYSGGDTLKTSLHKPLDLTGGQDAYENFTNCPIANGDCVMLKKGKLYTCTLIPNIETFNRYFEKNLEVTKRDYIDIYEDVTAEEILEFLCTPMPACRYCQVSKWTDGHPWRVSRKSMKEWT